MPPTRIGRADPSPLHGMRDDPPMTEPLTFDQFFSTRASPASGSRPTAAASIVAVSGPGPEPNKNRTRASGRWIRPARRRRAA